MTHLPYNGWSVQERNRSARLHAEAYGGGREPRPTICIACGQTQGRIDSHMEDYDDPWDGIMPLCYLCHLMVHCRQTNPYAFERYRRLILDGWRFRAVGGFGSVLRFLRGGDLPRDRVTVPKRDWLGEIDVGWHNPKHPAYRGRLHGEARLYIPASAGDVVAATPEETTLQLALL